MKTSRSSRLAKRCALLFVPAIPFVLGANEDGWSGSEELPPIPRPYASSWQIGCKNVQFNKDGVVISDASGCATSDFPQPIMYHTNADPRCNGEPRFYLADGRLYMPGFSNSLDLAPLLGGKTPNAPSAPIVTIPDSNLVYVFLGHVPDNDEEDENKTAEESPRAFFIAFDMAELQRNLQEHSRLTGIKGLFPLDIGPKENVGCRTIHLATVASDGGPSENATVFVSTCRHVYGIRIKKTGTVYSAERFFRDQIPLDRAKLTTHHRAEMEAARTKGGYAVFWPFERKEGAPAIWATILSWSGHLVSHRELPLDFGVKPEDPRYKLFIKGLEIAPNWRSFYVTWPGKPTSLFQFKLLDIDLDTDDVDARWLTDAKPLQEFKDIGAVGSSQITTGPDNVMYMREENSLVPGPNTMSPQRYDIGDGHISDAWGNDERIWFLPPVTRGATNGCGPWPAAESSGAGGSGMGGTGGVSESSGTMSSSGMGGAGGMSGSVGSSSSSGTMGSSTSSGAGGDGSADDMSDSVSSSTSSGTMGSSSSSGFPSSTSSTGGAGGAGGMSGSASSSSSSGTLGSSGSSGTGGAGGAGGMSGSVSSSSSSGTMGSSSSSSSSGMGGADGGSSTGTGGTDGGVLPPEQCMGGVDEDGDMLIDCADVDCNGKSCGSNGLTCSASICVCPGSTTEMICNDMMDNDCDGTVDCNDSNCTGTPSCSVEICDNNLDEDGDMLTDCADSDCNMMACGLNGRKCVMNTCACPSGMATEAMCNDMMDEDCDGLTDCTDPDCATTMVCTPVSVTSVDYPVIAHGGTLVVTGRGFMGATAVTIGGTNETFTVDSDTQITISSVADATPIAMQNLVVTAPRGTALPFGLTVIRLEINESDADTPMTDVLEFVEISTGVPNVSLAGYSIVFWNAATDLAYFVENLAKNNVVADANGLLLLGNPMVMPAPAITFNPGASGLLQNGPDGIGVYQAPTSAFVTMMSTSTVGLTRLIDALVYDTGAADPDAVLLLDNFFGPMGTMTRVQVDEGNGGVGGPAEMNAIQRCGNGRRNGLKFGVSTPTPGAMNSLPGCP